ncbi:MULTISPECIES: hypothetical protein [unclassified Streptomyces]|uniref:hypothetical protein n=1 Tax=unclassified Streptomyces TaxID=2593676 RepID=UPI0019258E06|nr:MULTISPECIES: hypothetical protein [unclassified Streptomyces]
MAAVRPSLELSLHGGEHFDERVLWSGIDGDLEGLHELAEAVPARVRDRGVAFAERLLRPRLTLARTPATTPPQ